VIERWFANKAMTEAVAEIYGVEVLYVWQPVPTYQYDLEYHPYANRNPASFGQHQRSGFGYQMMHDVLAEGGGQTRNILDLSGIQADRQERRVDIVHYSAAFSAETRRALGRQSSIADRWTYPIGRLDNCLLTIPKNSRILLQDNIFAPLVTFVAGGCWKGDNT
jgi:hypothetical protein